MDKRDESTLVLFKNHNFNLKFFLLFFLIFFMVSCEEENYINQSGKLVPKTVTEDTSLPSITINGAKLHSQAFGPVEGILVVCIHGGPGDNYKYLMNCKSLADKGFRVVFYDQIGSGLSQRFPKHWYMDKGDNAIETIFYEELKEIINYYKSSDNQKVVLLTHSWGSILATGFIGKFPNEIDGLILAEPGGLKWNDIKQYVENSQSIKLWSEAFNDATYLDQFISGKENDHNILDYKYSLLQTSNTITGDVPATLGINGSFYPSRRQGAVISNAMFEIGQNLNPDFTIGINQFQQKVLFFYSSNNGAYPTSWAERISAPFVNKELIKVDDVGHSGMFDQLTIWNTITEPKILDYLESL
ncbi:alpha/beta hydrolase [Flavobacterium sp.]|uniref:alpha/beta hydrolase n=1 Tax=Flavobacterium sp. TaxID=239 RepID=UPI002FD8A1B7